MCLEECEKDVSIMYKQRPSEIFIRTYNTVIITCLRANMNVQYISSVYQYISSALITY